MPLDQQANAFLRQLEEMGALALNEMTLDRGEGGASGDRGIGGRAGAGGQHNEPHDVVRIGQDSPEVPDVCKQLPRHE